MNAVGAKHFLISPRILVDSPGNASPLQSQRHSNECRQIGRCITVPPTKTKAPTKPRKSHVTHPAVIQHPTLTDARDLISIMLDYEATARTIGADPSLGRFAMLTASERQMLRSELIADYIRLSAGNSGTTPGFFDASLEAFCSKISDMTVPSHELIGTYLAAVDVVTKGEQLSKVAGLADAVRRTMVTVLHGCVETMRRQTQGIGNRE